ncbi:MAG: hypothetical protein WC071_11520 [Victivallaceae bacterium]
MKAMKDFAVSFYFFITSVPGAKPYFKRKEEQLFKAVPRDISVQADQLLPGTLRMPPVSALVAALA